MRCPAANSISCSWQVCLHGWSCFEQYWLSLACHTCTLYATRWSSSVSQTYQRHPDGAGHYGTAARSALLRQEARTTGVASLGVAGGWKTLNHVCRVGRGRAWRCCTTGATGSWGTCPTSPASPASWPPTRASPTSTSSSTWRTMRCDFAVRLSFAGSSALIVCMLSSQVVTPVPTDISLTKSNACLKTPHNVANLCTPTFAAADCAT